MSGSVNKVFLVGRLGADPEIKEVGQYRVVNVGLATSDTWKDKSGERQEKTVWHDLQFWNKAAEIVAQYARKGSLIYVEGSIEKREREGGGYFVNVKVSEFQFLDSKSDSQGSTPAREPAPAPAPAQAEPQSLDFPEDDIPF
tara:strand:- start:2178 stop:2603 length:426 start_codon:yes stop_codon:yes gene_type:complete